MNITEDFIIQFAGNSSTVSNGCSLAKGSFIELKTNAEADILFGSCTGSGKNPYQCSIDFIDSTKPVPRCNCPSRQLPCKHVIGLLFCKLQGKPFTNAAVPEDITEKRNKLAKKEEKKIEKEKAIIEGIETGTPIEEDPKKAAAKEKTKTRSALKKAQEQFAGITMAEKILHNIVLGGLHCIDQKNKELYESQVKELGNYDILGIQAALRALLRDAFDAQHGKEGEQDFTAAMVSLNFLYALLKKSNAYTGQKIAALTALSHGETAQKEADAFKEARLHSSIEEQMGYPWKLTELLEEGLFVRDAQLLQVGFNVNDDPIKKQFEDEGIWLSLSNGALYRTQNFRPYKVKQLKAEDSFFPVLTTPVLYLYPGDKNPRVRWDRGEQRETTPEDFAKAKDAGNANYAEVLKAVKKQLGSPLADKNPIYALKVSKVLLTKVELLSSAGEQKELLSIADESGVKIPLQPDGPGAPLLRHVSKAQYEGNTLVVRFAQDLKLDILFAQVIALITSESVLRFWY
ncbi:SWIM zinc finger family protein [Breznakiellaceae bacterium SP9]